MKPKIKWLCFNKYSDIVQLQWKKKTSATSVFIGLIPVDLYQ